ncbi:winged helix-turn-helix transcriptional regulator [Novosphingobium album (ex Liu et al. 2023)]|uniref:Helix-turn-helix domain-containing protein n=1 Tax=Novosphingobium album (ex Liu et al. 2023) TaxID=3031130 RepID=A0ABT5WPI8_9SPHN|nr:helix-turn-helix domain-containing protein [Novosphingobium album (ex Liu et al. 2023)]MDE8651965.1 helix-turn-helix domain-containing protein [Novosphingobium album (ex Liu et al. 2023)]
MKLRNETEESRTHGKWYDDACGAAFAMELVGERWSILVVRELMLGGRRFSDIRASLPGISAKVLAERLATLESAGIVMRARSGPPASVQIYALTDWGRAMEPVLQELGRWAVQSPMHNPRLPLTPVSLMLSMRTMFDSDAAGGLAMTVLFEVGETRFLGRLGDGELAIERIGPEAVAADVGFRAPAAGDFLPVFYGKQPPETPGLRLEITGDRALAGRFLDLFRLPPKHSHGCIVA